MSSRYRTHDGRAQYVVQAPEIVVRTHAGDGSFHRRGHVALLWPDEAESHLRRGDVIRIDEVA